MDSVNVRIRQSRCIIVFLLPMAGLLAGCPAPMVKDRPWPGEAAMPAVQTPPLKLSAAPTVDLDLLPEDARARLPSHDMGRIFMVMLPRAKVEMSSREVMDEAIVPLLRAMHFKPGEQGLRSTAEKGVRQPRPKLAGMARLLANEYQGNEKATRKRTLDMVDAFLGEKPPTADVERNLQIARGMSFAQFKADIERQEILYPFQQVHELVPIEHTLLLASRWEGQTITSVRGTLIHRYSVANRKPRSVEGVTMRAYQALAKVKNVDKVDAKRVTDGPWLVLLPYGNDSSGGVSLRYAWRMILDGYAYGRRVPFLTWMDAEDGRILKMQPLLWDVTAFGKVWRRDPGTGATATRWFEVDAASGGQYTLQLGGVANRVDYQADGFNASDVSISDSTNGSSATRANFDQAPINNGANAICSTGGNTGFQQVHYFALFHLNWNQSIAHGIYSPFPTAAWSPRLESASAGCNAWSSMDFGACQGYYDASCPNYSTGGTSGDNYMNFAHDSTIVGHELAHNSVARFTNTRPAAWCGTPPCAIPLGWSRFHDLTDAWADHFDNTNCTGGWVAKNLGGVDASNNCQGSRGHVEGGGLPRLHEVSVPFNPASPGDHFPEHRNAATGGYADMHIPAAALWQVREGMRSKCRPSGHPQYFVRFTRALKNTGFFGADPGSTDLGIYRYLYDLQLEMIEQWATSGLAGGPPAFAHNGNHTTNKVLAGFAKTGLFPIPAECIDGNAGTSDATSCPSGENGAEAVVDIDDNDVGDDLTIDAIDHPEHDFLRLGGPAPTFHVWTGSRFIFNGTDARPITNTAPCNSKFQVEVATDAAFPPASTVTSGWINVDTDNTTAASPECYGTWSPDAAQWLTLQAGGHLTRLYYRARTRDATDGNERVSTQPAAGLWTVPPPYAVITTTGQSDY